MASADGNNGNGTPGYLIFDTESVPDGRLLALVKYAGDRVGPEEAIRRAQAEARERSFSGSDFLPVSFQVPVATCVLRAGGSVSCWGRNDRGQLGDGTLTARAIPVQVSGLEHVGGDGLERAQAQ